MSPTLSHPVIRACQLAVATAAAAVLLSACGASQPAAGGSATSTAAAASTAASSAASSAAAGELSITDAWVKATDGAEDPSMTAAFGVIRNTTDKPLTIVSATNSASVHTELHEMAMDNGAMVMRPVAGGIPVPAEGTTTLEPGGLHVMIMDVTQPIKAGDDVTVTLTADDGSTLQFTALAKDFAGANESYSPSTGAMAGMSGMDMPSSSGMSMPAGSASPSAGG
ncbi:copper chaperone PCu(A)C [Nakamurella flava]|uniref:copper chaperone PCu(A)C n=1 Tax=Nakamurella flava TaxID=2576308 RepID=UPI00197B83C0|nr:copper chaperone PCu(A)C [Nakamurella flava]